MTDLIEKLEAAEGGSKELDRLIAESVDGRVRLAEEHREEEGHWWWHWTDKHGQLMSGGWATAIPHYTASLDAALALMERVLPGCFWLIGKGRTRPDEPLYGVKLLLDWSGDPAASEARAMAEHDSLPIAICLAILHALKDQNNG